MTACPHPSFPAPTNRNIRIWRYMDLTKFVWMLQRQALFFARADILGDPYEGHYTRYTALAEDEFVRSVEAGTEFEKWKTMSEADLRKSYKEMLEGIKKVKLEMFVSSWHMNDEESAAMWRLYTTLNEAICVTSTFQNLFDALPPAVYFGGVEYIDYERDPINMNNVFNYIMHKRRSYMHENEARAVLNAGRFGSGKFTEENGGVRVGIDLTSVVESVYLSPSSTPLLRGVLEGLLVTYGLNNVPVLQSGVNAPPPY
jgi:hypothetical protein